MTVSSGAMTPAMSLEVSRLSGVAVHEIDSAATTTSNQSAMESREERRRRECMRVSLR
ncbi:MAG: hypothetical protein AAGA81_13890 [Acidobacteriota bacterium]